MDVYVLPKIVIKLMAVISSSLPGDAISTPPQISFVPPAALQERVCGRPCPAYAVFLPRHGILIDDRLDPVNDPNARGILLHELVHYVQWRRAGRQNAQNCHEWSAREDEAYSLQYRWLTKQIAGQLGYPNMRRRPVLCVGPKPEERTAQAEKPTKTAVAAAH